MLLSDREIREMADRGAAQRIEVCLSVGPRVSRDTGRVGAILDGRLAGVDDWPTRSKTCAARLSGHSLGACDG